MNTSAEAAMKHSTNIATNRTTKAAILTSYITNQRFGFSYDRRKDIYEALDGFTLQDVVDFNHQYIKGQPKIYMVLGRENEIDLKQIEEKFGPVKKLTLEEIFGY